MQEKRQTLIADFAIQGRMAYLSHQETLTMFQRAFLRAAIPVAFSGGFNPRPRLSIPLPRSVGTQSTAERICAVLSTDELVDVSAVRSRLSHQLPLDCVLLDVQCIEGKSSFHPCGVRYVFTLSGNLTEEQQRHLAACQRDIETGERIEVQRYLAKKKKHQSFDIFPFVGQLNFCGNQIEVFCRVSQEGSVRIDELMQWFQLEANQLKEPVKRTAIQWEQNYQEQD